MNIVGLTGGLTRDPELRHTADGTPVCNLRLAFRQKLTDTGYVDVTCWAATAEAVTTYKRRGDRLAVSGELRWREFTADDGSKRQVNFINAHQVEFLGVRREDDPAEHAGAVAAANGAVPNTDDIPF